VLAAQWADYGGLPKDASFGMHATVMRGYYSDGAYYPVGGAKVFAATLVLVIEKVGGAVRLKAPVREVLVEHGAVVGVRLDDGTEFRSGHVFSDAGARNTVGLLPASLRESAWAREILSFKPAVCHVGLYLGLEGDIRANGATLSNHWFLDSWDLDAGVWLDPMTEPSPPGMFVHFPSLKDPGHDPGPKQRHTAEIVAVTSWDAFSRWQDSTHRDRPEQYLALKATIERSLLAQFARRFPALAPMVVCRELSTPLTTADFIGAQQGGMYGLEVSPRRFLSDSLRARTPVPGLFLTGQDVVTPGVMGALAGGVLAAAAIEPRLYARLG
jgi:all-trans-retinol 13,14-reductase